MKSSPLNTPSNRNIDAFSLVEVTIALAIASLGFITILGVLPQGLDMARQSANLSAQSRIAQQLTGELQALTWDDITWTGHGPRRFYTDQGVEIPQKDISKAEFAMSLSYVASVYVPAQALDFTLPAAGSKTAGQKQETYMRRVRIDVALSVTPDVDFTKIPARRVMSFPAVLAKMGAD